MDCEKSKHFSARWETLAFAFISCIHQSVDENLDNWIHVLHAQKFCRRPFRMLVSYSNVSARLRLSVLLYIRSSGGSSGGQFGVTSPPSVCGTLDINAPVFGAYRSRTKDKKYSKLNNVLHFIELRGFAVLAGRLPKFYYWIISTMLFCRNNNTVLLFPSRVRTAWWPMRATLKNCCFCHFFEKSEKTFQIQK